MRVLIKDYPEYAVESTGEVWSFRTDRYLKQHTRQDGYKTLHLRNHIKGTTLRVHRLVAEAFIPNPDNLPYVNHKDGDRANNHVSNLEWCTHQYNQEHGCAQHYKFLSPDGECVEVYNLNQFCKERGLITACMCRVNSGERFVHKGWKRYERE